MTTRYSYEVSVTGTPALIICLCIYIPLIILMIVAHWRTYSKANEPGWASLVPFYNSYVMFKISNKKGLFWANLIFSILMIGAFAGLFILMFNNGFWYYDEGVFKDYYYIYNNEVTYNMIMIICGGIILVSSIVIFIIRIIQYVGLSNAFGKGGGFAVGLLFLYPIFICILGFSSNSQYIGSSQMGYGYGNPYGQQNPYGQPNPYGQQNPYGQPNQYGQPNPYGQPNQYGQPNPYGQANQYGQQNGYNQPNQGDPQNPYGQ